jgi:hypothetical protein
MTEDELALIGFFGLLVLALIGFFGLLVYLLIDSYIDKLSVRKKLDDFERLEEFRSKK